MDEQKENLNDRDDLKEGFSNSEGNNDVANKASVTEKLTVSETPINEKAMNEIPVPNNTITNGDDQKAMQQKEQTVLIPKPPVQNSMPIGQAPPVPPQSAQQPAGQTPPVPPQSAQLPAGQAPPVPPQSIQLPVGQAPPVQQQSAQLPVGQVPPVQQQGTQPPQVQSRAPGQIPPGGFMPMQGKPISLENPSKKKKSKKFEIIIITIIIVVLIAGGILAFFLFQNNKYNNALALIKAENYSEAVTELSTLGNFKDSATYLKKCQDYLTAESSMQAKDYAKASELFAALGDFGDASEQKIICDQYIAYNDGIRLMEEKKYSEAIPIFESLGNFNDAPAQKIKCENYILYDEATKLMNEGNYAQASEKFASLGNFEDASDKATYCENKAIYNKAQADLEKGLNYSAYVGFLSLGDFEDAQAKKESCVVEFPGNAEIYHNPNYVSSQSTFVVEAKTDSLVDKYCVKLYSESGDLVSVITLNAGAKKQITVPAGNYKIQIGRGMTMSDWYGQEEMFGVLASYGYYTAEDGSDIVTFSTNYGQSLILGGSVTTV